MIRRPPRSTRTDTLFPYTTLFRSRAHRRLTPHIYTGCEIVALLTAARRLPPAHTIRPATYETMLGLIAATGLRLSEATKLQCGDVDIADRCLTVRMTKLSKSRHVPFNPPVAAALASHLVTRSRSAMGRYDDPFIVVV